MGFLDKILKAGTTELELTVDPDRVPAGGDVHVRWDLGGEIDDKDRAIRAGVTATGYFLAYDDDEHYDQHDRDAHRDRRVEQRSFEVYEHAEDLPLQLGPGGVTIKLPAEAPPGSAGVLKWTAWARVDRKGGKDDAQEATIYVRRPAQEVAPEDVAHDGFKLTGIPRAVRLGKTYTGEIDFTPADDVKGVVKARMIRRCRFDSRDGFATVDLPDLLGMSQLPGSDLFASQSLARASLIIREETELELELSEKEEFAAGRTRSFALELPVPRKGPTTSHHHATVDWRLEIVLDRKLRGDLKVVLPLDVS